MYQPARQDFHQIKNYCLQSRTLFEDPEFPPGPSSIFLHGRPDNKYLARVGTIYWKRPHEITSRPKFFADGVSRFDVIQGEIGNCWFIAAVSNLTLHPILFEQVVPRENAMGFDQGQYCGAFIFRFWCYGYWFPVVVDDRLPVNSRGELLFMQSADKSEFWSCLLEKAYAKFHGCYQSLSGGVAAEALQDFSGGIVESIDIEEFRAKYGGRDNEAYTELFGVMKKAHQRQSLMSCALHNKFGTAREVRTAQGLVEGHAYSVTGVAEVPIYNGAQLVPLLRIRNPWGDFEWNGPWSDRSSEWNMVDQGTKARLGLTKRNDGEFWMSAGDFQERFHRLEICHLSPDPVSDLESGMRRAIESGGQIPWKRMVFEGAWLPGSTAGGCMNYDSFYTNPQYFFDFTASAVDGDADKCTVVVSLIQRTASRSWTRKAGVGKACIGFRIFRVKQYTGNLGPDFFSRHRSQSLGSGAYSNSREVSGRFELPTGTYVIVPSTYEQNEAGNFLLRIFSEPPPPQMQMQQNYQSYAMPGNVPMPPMPLFSPQQYNAMPQNVMPPVPVPVQYGQPPPVAATFQGSMPPTQQPPAGNNNYGWAL